MKRTFSDWDEAIREAERLVRTPQLIEITVTLHAAFDQAVTMDYRIKRAVLPKEGTT